MVKLRIPRKQSIERNGIGLMGIEEEAKGSEKVAAFGEVGDERGG